MNFVNYIYRMRIAAIFYIILSVIANFIVDNLTVFVLALFSFPLLLWLILRKKNKMKKSPFDAAKKNETIIADQSLSEKMQHPDSNRD